MTALLTDIFTITDGFSAAGYGSLYSLVAHKDKFIDEPQRLLLEKVFI